MKNTQLTPLDATQIAQYVPEYAQFSLAQKNRAQESHVFTRLQQLINFPGEMERSLESDTHATSLLQSFINRRITAFYVNRAKQIAAKEIRALMRDGQQQIRQIIESSCTQTNSCDTPVSPFVGSTPLCNRPSDSSSDEEQGLTPTLPRKPNP